MEKGTTLGKLIVFSAPSGAGKSTIANRILAEVPNLYFSVSATTRKMRPGEQEGHEYFFLSKEEFEQKIAEKRFIEYEQFFGNYYGTLKDKTDERLEKGENLLFDLDVKGAVNLKKLYGEHAVLIFIKPPSLEALKERLLKRSSDSIAEIENRLERAAFELSFANQFDFEIVNDELETAIQSIKAFILKSIQQPSK
ncbi:Guanylate kinase [Chloroherpeton thalassium ATCC 35110]|uniref:Guanylate kinase n=1 Tax=Chloroherpeton thalassium (strain ATCC 35110 / GB-78) TaxID=517418 RepID=B3QXA4_CHLT3|nr:guanylate kinase [Chloroherpeton thalassium]ACF13378.1 Guanylate kinase [Chloroherpeton thalassium ATCC 35110]